MAYQVAMPLWWTGYYLGKGLHWAAAALGTAFYYAVSACVIHYSTFSCERTVSRYCQVARPMWWLGFYLAVAASAAGHALYWTIYYAVRVMVALFFRVIVA